MRTMRYCLCFVLLGVLFFSCGKSVKEQVKGRWKIEDITAPEPDLSAVPDSLKNYYTQQLEKQNTLLLTTGYYEFNAEGQSFFEFGDNRMEGKWRLSDDEKQIFLKGKGELKESAFEIREISETVFIIELTEQGQTTRMVLKKAVGE